MCPPKIRGDMGWLAKNQGMLMDVPQFAVDSRSSHGPLE